jgi:hypothetical protein
VARVQGLRTRLAGDKTDVAAPAEMLPKIEE